MKYGLYLNESLMAKFETEDEVYSAAESEAMLKGVAHDVKQLSFAVDEDFCIDDIDGCEFIHDTSIGKAIISLETDGEWGTPTGRIEVVYPDGSVGKIEPDDAQQMIDIGKWIVYR
ncbi:hypothetical protein [Sporosarcina sp. FSL K6-1508]|uniref:hypothetical protein n=1 Tax=Sporosarcina sp. FSL K6-1508 TaxID=2921553 RepID=UPI0030F6F382